MSKYMDMMDGWVSPVELIYEDAKNRFLKQTDEFIMARCEASLGVKVDKDELIKAMHYDREQYKKGFANGYKQRETEIVHCEDCKYYETEGNYCNRDIVKSLLPTEPTDFCSWAERRESDG